MDNSNEQRRVRRLLRAEGDPLIRIGWAIGAMLTLAVLIAAGLTIAGLFFLNIHGTRAEPLSATTLYDLLKIAFAVAAGIGGVIALVTAYRRQRYIEIAENRASREEQLATRAEDRAARDSQLEHELARIRLLNERFTTAAGQLGDDKPAVQLAGVYAMAGLADDWPAQRQTCIDVLCAYLRMPYQPDPGDQAPATERQAFRALREVRHTVIRVITAHLQPDHKRAVTTHQDWRGYDFDFTGAIFDGGNFHDAQFSGGAVSFSGAEFSGGAVSFGGAEFSGGAVSFGGARFSGGRVYFSDAEFSGGTVNFVSAQFSGGEVNFGGAQFSGGAVYFSGAQFSGGAVYFSGAQFSGGAVNFGGARFSGGAVGFGGARFSGGEVNFVSAQFSDGTVGFGGARFSGSAVDFSAAQFTGAQVDFSAAADWEVPAQLPSWETPPPGVTLPPGHPSS